MPEEYAHLEMDLCLGFDVFDRCNWARQAIAIRHPAQALQFSQLWLSFPCEPLAASFIVQASQTFSICSR